MIIGVLYNPNLSEEIWKEEAFIIDLADRPWLKDIIPMHQIVWQGNVYTSDDLSIAYYIKWVLRDYPNHKVLIISPLDEEAYAKIQSTDITFTIIFDLLEAFHTLPMKIFKQIKRLLEMPNIYPPVETQLFFNNKNVYYDYFTTKGINTLPSLLVKKADYVLNSASVIKKVMEFKTGDMGKIIGKPIYGQESIDVFVFNPPITNDRIDAYLEKLFRTYEGVIFQPFSTGLSEGIEYKVMFVGHQYMYFARVTGKDTSICIAGDESEKEHRMLAFAKNVLKTLPPIKYDGILSARLLTRVDVGCCYKDNFFVSEVEFVPSLFLPEIENMKRKQKPKLQIDKELGDQLLCICRQLYHSKKN